MTTKRERSRRKRDRSSHVMTAGHRHRKKLNSLASRVEKCADHYRAVLNLLCIGFMGYAIVLLTGSFSPVFKRELESYDWVILVYALVLCVMLAFVVEALSRRIVLIKRLRTETAIERLRRDQRPPVLYLRPFDRDAEASLIYELSYKRHGGDAGFHSGMVDITGTTRRSEEDCIVEFFDRVGPVIAIGNPGDKTPFTGAARYYVDNQGNWTEVVTKFLNKAAMVVLHAGLTEGLLWELETVIRKVSPERLFLLISFTKEEYDRFKMATATVFFLPLPEHPGYFLVSPLRSNVPTTINGFITFDADWTPHFIRMPPTSGWFSGFDGESYLKTNLPEVFAPFLARLEAAGNPSDLPIVDQGGVRDVLEKKPSLEPFVQV